MKFNEGFLARMQEATNLLRTEGPAAATAAIQRALNDGSATSHEFSAPSMKAAFDAIAAGPNHRSEHQAATESTTRSNTARKWSPHWGRQDIEDVDAVEGRETGKPGAAASGRFISASCTNRAGTRAYKLYIPSGYKDEPLPLLVMLHGCTQNPEDFAKGTGMNELAEQANFLVAYPEQSQASNASRCWNWFQPGDQRRDEGEPSIVADMTREIMARYHVDERRIYVAGLSAGGAMAAVMAATYPDIFAAVGVHSGLPYGVARDMPSAFATMKHTRGKASAMKMGTRAPVPLAKPVPVIVFQGSQDATVHPANADLILEQLCSGGRKELSRSSQEEKQEGVRTSTRTIVYCNGEAVGEKWIVHGAPHAWSGGSREGSYTDPQGPSAAKEMMRFFSQHQRVAGN